MAAKGWGGVEVILSILVVVAVVVVCFPLVPKNSQEVLGELRPYHLLAFGDGGE